MEPEPTPKLPPKWVRHLAMTLLGLHASLIGLSGIQSAGLPETINGLLSLSSPYLQSTRFGFDVDSLSFTTGGADDRAVVLEFASTKAASNGMRSSDWQVADFKDSPGLAAADRKQRFFVSAVTMAENDLYGLAAQWMAPTAAQLPDASGIRLVRPPTLMTTVADDQQPAPYEARLIRDPNKRESIAWVHVQPPRLAAIADSDAPEAAQTPTNSNDEEVFEAPNGPSEAVSP